MNLLLIGHVCIDENHSEGVSYRGWGSSLMYMAKYLNSHSNHDISLLAPFGEDFIDYTDGMNFINPPSGTKTLLYMNESKNGKRTQKCQRIDLAKPIQLNRKIKNKIANADAIVVAPLLPSYSSNYIRKLLKYKNPSCLTALLVQGFLRKVEESGLVKYRTFEEASDILPLFNMVLASDDDISNAKGVLSSWAKQSPSTNIIMTEGEKGACWIKENGSINFNTVPIPSSELVDTVGCGDIFSAATILSFLKTSDLGLAIAAGNKAAGQKLRFASPLSVK